MKEQRVEAVERALSVLEAFGETRGRLTLAEIAEETGLYKSTILRLCGSLIRFGYLTRDPDGTFRLGPSLWRLGSSYRRNFDLGEYIRPALRRLVEDTGETASFFVREADERLCLYRENSRNPVRHHLDEGVRLPLDRGASGLVLRAFGGAGGNNDRVRRDGYAVSVAERSPDIAAVAVPILHLDGSIRGALAVSGLASRFNKTARKRALAALRSAAADLQNRL